MAKPKVLITRNIFPEWIEAIMEECDGELWEDELPPPRDVLLEKVQGLDGLLCLLTEAVNAELMDAAGPQLKVISQIAVGFDNIDVPEATRRGIPVGNTPEVLTETTADATWALMLAAARRIVESNRAVHAGNWRTWHPLHYLGQDILRRDPRHRRPRPHRHRRRAQGRRLRNARPVLRCLPPRGHGVRDGRRVRRHGHAPRRVRLRLPPHEPDAREPPLHERRRVRQDEGDRHRGQRRPRPGHRPARPVSRPD